MMKPMTKMSGDTLVKALRQSWTKESGPENSKSEQPASSSQTRDTWVGGGVFLLGLIVVSFVVQPSEEEQAQKVQSGFHCLSSWDGSHPRLVDAVKASLNEPGSFEHVETKVTPVHPNGRHDLLMDFRARNAFGGMIRSTARASYLNSDCTIVTWHVLG